LTSRVYDPISADLAEKIVQFLTDTPPKTLAPRYLKLAVNNLAALYASPRVEEPPF
jgi:hypothetical protein